MSIDFASVRAITIPEGAVKMITAPDGTVLWKLGYTWKKYNVVSETKYVESRTSVSQERIGAGGSARLSCATAYSINSNTGEYTLVSPTTQTAREYSSSYSTYPYVLATSDASNAHPGSMYYANSVIVSIRGTLITGYRYDATQQTTYSRGTYIEDVTATDANAYPDNGKHTDGYWYVKQA